MEFGGTSLQRFTCAAHLSKSLGIPLEGCRVGETQPASVRKRARADVMPPSGVQQAQALASYSPIVSFAVLQNPKQLF